MSPKISVTVRLDKDIWNEFKAWAHGKHPGEFWGKLAEELDNALLIAMGYDPAAIQKTEKLSSSAFLGPKKRAKLNRILALVKEKLDQKLDNGVNPPLFAFWELCEIIPKALNLSHDKNPDDTRVEQGWLNRMLAEKYATFQSEFSTGYAQRHGGRRLKKFRFYAFDAEKLESVN